MAQDNKTVSFIAPSGARVIVKDWAAACHVFNGTGVMLAVVFNDPIFKTLEGK
jgi:hypothetical protein